MTAILRQLTEKGLLHCFDQCRAVFFYQNYITPTDSLFNRQNEWQCKAGWNLPTYLKLVTAAIGGSTKYSLLKTHYFLLGADDK